MGSADGTTPTMSKRLMHVKAKRPEVESLKALGDLLKGNQRSTFYKEYGKILDLLKIEVQVEAITALAEFYDSPLRCFTLQDFQLAPTLEEFQQILGYPLKNGKPYQYMGHYPSIPLIAEVLKVTEGDLDKGREMKKGTDGISKSYLEKKARELAKKEDWGTFRDVFALAIFGIILFPNADELVDFAVIDVFLAFKLRKENPVHAVLADLYHTLDFCHEKKGKRILCCLPALYIWLITHVFSSGCKTYCPIDDFKMCQVKTRTSREWAQTLVNLGEGTVRWYPKWKEIKEVNYQCGGFPNVPLMGTRGYINYNPALALRQLGYPIMGPPSDEVITPFVLYGMGPQNKEMMRKVSRAWDKVVTKKGREIGVWSCDAKDIYRQWLKERVLKIKLPFYGLINVIKETPIQEPPCNEEVEKLKAALTKSDEEKNRLRKELAEVRRAYEKLQLEVAQKTTSLEKANKRARSEEESNLKTRDCLFAADIELGKRRQERDEALAVNRRLKDMVRNSKVAERNAIKQLGDLNEQLTRVVAEYEKRVDIERQRKEDATEMATFHEEALRGEQGKTYELKNLTEEQKIIIEQLNDENTYLRDQVIRLNSFAECQKTLKQLQKEGEFWRNQFAKLAKLTNQALADMPRFLKEAEQTLNPFTTPIEVSKFIKHCKEEIGKLKKGSVINGVHVQVWVQCTPL